MAARRQGQRVSPAPAHGGPGSGRGSGSRLVSLRFGVRLLAWAGVWWRGMSVARRAVAGAAGAVAVVAVAGLVVWLAVPGGPAVRARQYLALTACLLTGGRGLAQQPAATVWAGMESASSATRAKVEYFPVMSGSTEAAALPYVAGLVQRGCAVVFAAGAAQVAAVDAVAARYPSVRFVVAGQGSGRRVTSLPSAPRALRAAVSQIITSAVRHGG